MKLLGVFIAALALSLVTSVPASADPPGPYLALNNNDPASALSPQERATLAAKERLFQDHWRQHRKIQSAGGGPSPYSIPNPGGSWPLSVTLGVSPKQQELYYYCGPASTQAVESYSKQGSFHSQGTIAVTENTNNDLSTYVWRDRVGLNTYVQMPSGFVYAEYQPASDGEWWARLQEDIAGYGLPQVVTVAPHDSDATAWLPSWPNAITAGHFIVLGGYYGYNSSDSGASVTYADSSGGFSGGTGTYSTSSTTMRYVIVKTNAQHAGNWIIW